eukprot:3941019-Rhodomonas_salina.6
MLGFRRAWSWSAPQRSPADTRSDRDHKDSEVRRGGGVAAACGRVVCAHASQPQRAAAATATATGPGARSGGERSGRTDTTASSAECRRPEDRSCAEAAPDRGAGMRPGHWGFQVMHPAGKPEARHAVTRRRSVPGNPANFAAASLVQTDLALPVLSLVPRPVSVNVFEMLCSCVPPCGITAPPSLSSASRVRARSRVGLSLRPAQSRSLTPGPRAPRASESETVTDSELAGGLGASASESASPAAAAAAIRTTAGHSMLPA